MTQNISEDIYQQLKVIANKLMQGERSNHTLSPTDLVHEAFLKYNKQEKEELNDKHFMFILARQMRRLLVDYGRQKSALKRGGSRQRVVYTDALGIHNNSMTDFSLISDAIENLSTMDERAAQAIDLFYFTKVTKQNTASLLNISIPTLERDLRFAKAHISQYLSDQL